MLFIWALKGAHVSSHDLSLSFSLFHLQVRRVKMIPQLAMNIKRETTFYYAHASLFFEQHHGQQQRRCLWIDVLRDPI